MVSPLGNAIQFFKDFGLFDVVLPFLLVFSIVFAILEKTRVLGEEADMPKRTLNSMVAFVTALLVVAVNKVVYAINKALPNVVLLIVIVVSFLMLVGLFYKEGEFDFKTEHPKWTAFFVAILFILIVIIFLDSVMVGDTDQSMLDTGLEYVVQNITGPAVTSAIFVLIAIGAIIYIVGFGTKSQEVNKRG